MKALSHDLTCENIDIWNYGTKSPDDISLKSMNPMKIERRRHLEFANASQGFPTADGCNDVDFDVMLNISFRASAAGEQILSVNGTFSRLYLISAGAT